MIHLVNYSSISDHYCEQHALVCRAKVSPPLFGCNFFVAEMGATLPECYNRLAMAMVQGALSALCAFGSYSPLRAPSPCSRPPITPGLIAQNNCMTM